MTIGIAITEVGDIFGRGRGYDNNYNQFQSRPWSTLFKGDPGEVVVIQPRGRGYMPQAGTGDPEYKGIPQYKYICGVCRNKGHYDHQCHTLQHLAHAIQTQQAQGYNGSQTIIDNPKLTMEMTNRLFKPGIPNP